MTIITESAYRDAVEIPASQLVDLSLFVPRFKVNKHGWELDGKVYAVHLRRKYQFFPLFVKPLYLGCYVFFKKQELDPNEIFARTHYNPNYYSFRRNKIAKNTKDRTALVKRLERQTTINDHNGRRSVYFAVMARYNDPNTKINFDFTARSFSINTSIYVGKRFLEKNGDVTRFDYATFYESFLYHVLNYPAAVYAISRKYGTVHRLIALQDILERVPEISGRKWNEKNKTWLHDAIHKG
jgi:hypothetical protein